MRGCTNMSRGTPRACANVGGTARHATLDRAPRVERLRIAERGGALRLLRPSWSFSPPPVSRNGPSTLTSVRMPAARALSIPAVVPSSAPSARPTEPASPRTSAESVAAFATEATARSVTSSSVGLAIGDVREHGERGDGVGLGRLRGERAPRLGLDEAVRGLADEPRAGLRCGGRACRLAAGGRPETARRRGTPKATARRGAVSRTFACSFGRALYSPFTQLAWCSGASALLLRTDETDCSLVQFRTYIEPQHLQAVHPCAPGSPTLRPAVGRRRRRTRSARRCGHHAASCPRRGARAPRPEARAPQRAEGRRDLRGSGRGHPARGLRRGPAAAAVDPSLAGGSALAGARLEFAAAMRRAVPPAPAESAAVDALLRASDPSFLPFAGAAQRPPTPPAFVGYPHHQPYAYSAADQESPSVAPVAFPSAHMVSAAYAHSTPAPPSMSTPTSRLRRRVPGVGWPSRSGRSC